MPRTPKGHKRPADAIANAVWAMQAATGVTLLEYFPYGSRHFAHHRLRVPSQDFTFDLLRSAIRRDAAIFITRGRSRGRNIWESAVPELRGYTQAYRTNSVLNVVISRKNCPDGYQAAKTALQQLATS